ncbi:hypothetical protein ABIE26_003245 [Pedobacter africanus]|uniref:Uncharacterized protein n=1 Tax=Pedobacter africanus TaxID=151894 RepID=A0ACC6KZ18_9SPHI|nr:hypothetical protein [Pedobacter africanus]MDR6784599.1 hypothetical protein [Pedobacter africanus]
MKRDCGMVWRHYCALNELYLKGQTSAKISSNDFINAVLIRQKRFLRPKMGNLKILEAQKGYKEYYEKEFKEDFERFNTFLSTHKLSLDARQKYTADDILTLIFIEDNKSALKANLTTIRKFSNVVFKGFGSKYLESRPGLLKAVCKLLDISSFPEKEPKNLQWRLTVDCLNPKAIVLCENLAFLKTPWAAREHNVELWYVGGNNTAIIDYISNDKLLLPIYYSCDWDYHGLLIFQNISERMILKGCKIKLLFPNDPDERLPVIMKHHKSKWIPGKELSGLKQSLFNVAYTTLIQDLIKNDQWIEEESFEFVELLRQNGVIVDYLDKRL